MKAFATLTFACLLAAAFGQKKSNACNFELLFLFDVSENARFAASESWSTKPFQYLIGGIQEFLAEVPEGVLLGAYSYSSSDELGTIIPEGSTVAQALELMGDMGGIVNGGSWTTRGLSKIQSSPKSENNLLVVVSSQGSVNPALIEEAKQESDRLRELGWKIHVIGVKGRNEMDMGELKYVNGNRRFTILNDRDAKDPKSYKLLGANLKSLLTDICPSE